MKTRVGIWLILSLCLEVFIVSSCRGPARLRYKPVPEEVIPPSGSYLDFEDIQIPNGLTLERNKSYLYVTESLKTGMLSFKTSRPVDEVLAYFTENMPRDNWESVSVFKFRKNIMLYRKAGKNCLIIIEESAEGPDQLVVEIWVSPQGASKKTESLLKKIIKK
ncbi:MAG: hypothetical protein JRI54_05945 [Deltaproteobacteria bacterium]|nr:hypothetical protein [Deltaproteobacteria bacterium]